MEELVDESNTAGPRERGGSAKDNYRERKTPFRFKSRASQPSSSSGKTPSHRRKRRKVEDSDSDGTRSRRSHQRSDGHRKKNGSDEPHHEPPNPTYEMDAETAFRESLFDALADDEGAAFWEGVYGQPIHTYPDTKPDDSLDGGLRRMSDEEYTAFVRQQMWEKTHQHVLEERRRREEATKKREEARKQNARMESDRDAFNKRMEESLRRGEARRKERAWRDAWASYVRGWERLLAPRTDSPHQSDPATTQKGSHIPWPVRTGEAADVGKDQIEAFFEHAPVASGGSRDSLKSLLKMERVRWHPDKMQQRLGRDKIDEATLQKVVAVFQIVDAHFGRL